MHEIVKYFILTEIRSEIVNFRSRSDLGDFPRDLAHSRCMEQCMVADLSAGLGTAATARLYGYREIPRENSTVSFILTVDLSMRAECMHEK